MALIAGYQAPFGTVMGHAGAFKERQHEYANEKAGAFVGVGVILTDHPSKFGYMMKQMLDDPHPENWRDITISNSSRPRQTSVAQTRDSKRLGIHTATQRSLLHSHQLKYATRRHGHFLSSKRSLEFLRAHQFPITTKERPESKKDVDLSIRVNRSSGRLQVTISSPSYPDDAMTGMIVQMDELSKSTCHEKELDAWRRAPSFCEFRTSFSRTNGAELPRGDPTGYLPKLIQIFINEEAFSMLVSFHGVDGRSGFVYEVSQARIGLDSLVYAGAKTPSGSLEQREVNLPELNPAEEAAKEGIVYVKLHGSGTIGTLVNGAGLAMNTIDAFTGLGGECANFLDTGGKATSATVKTSFHLVLADPRVKVIFVNIFGGLTLCDMIAEGIMLAYKDLGIKTPVVVRLRGTNEEIGQKMVSLLQSISCLVLWLTSHLV
ncbi:MAG: hypothetical protein Q9216_003361 [Gyalolechia sp. 2 TL-2023]